MKVSECCGARPRGNYDIGFDDVGLCSACHEHCDYVEEGCGVEGCDCGEDEEAIQKSMEERALRRGGFIK